MFKPMAAECRSTWLLSGFRVCVLSLFCSVSDVQVSPMSWFERLFFERMFSRSPQGVENVLDRVGSECFVEP